MISVKFSHGSDRCLMTVASFIQAAIFLPVSTILWKFFISSGYKIYVYGPGIYTILAFFWTVTFFVCFVGMVKSGQKITSVFCCLIGKENFLSLLFLVILCIPPVIVASVEVILTMYVSIDTFDPTEFRILFEIHKAAFLAYLAVLLAYVVAALGKAAHTFVHD